RPWWPGSPKTRHCGCSVGGRIQRRCCGASMSSNIQRKTCRKVLAASGKQPGGDGSQHLGGNREKQRRQPSNLLGDDLNSRDHIGRVDECVEIGVGTAAISREGAAMIRFEQGAHFLVHSVSRNLASAVGITGPSGNRANIPVKVFGCGGPNAETD